MLYLTVDIFASNALNLFDIVKITKSIKVAIIYFYPGMILDGLIEMQTRFKMLVIRSFFKLY